MLHLLAVAQQLNQQYLFQTRLQVASHLAHDLSSTKPASNAQFALHHKPLLPIPMAAFARLLFLELDNLVLFLTNNHILADAVFE